MDIDKARKRIDRWFPELATAGYEPTSEESINYNCIAWAAGETHRRWDPAPGYFWPLEILRDDKIETLVTMFESLGFKRLEQFDAQAIVYEIGVEKVALYADGSSWTHAARQLSNSRWTSKLGDIEDIQHDRLEGFHAVYGDPHCVMVKRQLR